MDWRTVARFVAALALVLVAFGHGRMDAAQAGAPDLSAYAFPDGSLPVICFTGGEDHTGKGGSPNHCKGCPVAVSALPVGPTAYDFAHHAEAAATVVAATFEVVSRRVFPPQAPPQAPPLA